MSEDQRRKHARYKVHWPCRLLLSSKKLVTAKIKDISAGGVGIQCDEDFAVGDEVNIEISPLLKGKTYMVRARGVITFSMILGGSNGFSSGLRFTLVPEEHDKVLQSLLKSLAPD